jgi:tellurite resistance protein
MPKLMRCNRVTTGIPAELLVSREGEILDAVVTAAALVSRTGGWVEPAEGDKLLNFLEREEFLTVFSRAEMLDLFERSVREMRLPGGSMMASDRLRQCARHTLGQCARHTLAPLIPDIGEQIAAADCRLDPREERIPQRLFARAALRRNAEPRSTGNGNAPRDQSC